MPIAGEQSAHTPQVFSLHLYFYAFVFALLTTVVSWFGALKHATYASFDDVWQQ